MSKTQCEWLGRGALLAMSAICIWASIKCFRGAALGGVGFLIVIGIILALLGGVLFLAAVLSLARFARLMGSPPSHHSDGSGNSSRSWLDALFELWYWN
jgi:hypothetical protein